MNPNTKHQLSDQQILELGQQAANAMANPVFAILYDQQRARYYREWQELQPDRVKEMAHLKAKHDALVEFMNGFTSLVAQANDIIRKQQEINSPEAQERRRLDTQGFGLNELGSDKGINRG